jgi:hypothetical protein
MCLWSDEGGIEELKQFKRMFENKFKTRYYP